MNYPQFVRAVVLADEFGLPESFFKNEGDAGRLPMIRIKGRRYFDVEAVRQALQERMRANSESEKGGRR